MTTIARMPITALIRMSGRSWWEVKLLGGKTIFEWETAGSLIELPLAGAQRHSRWNELDHSRVVAARLLCPDGSVGEVQATGPYRIFQFKSGRRIHTFPGADQGGIVDAHVLGTLDGELACHGWEWTRTGLERFYHPSILTLSQERYGQAPLNLEAIGIRL